MNIPKIEIKWAVIFSISAILWMLLEKLVGLHDVHINNHPIYTNLYMIVAIIVFVFAFLDKKKSTTNFTFINALKFGLLLTLFITILTPINQTIISELISPDYFKNAINYAVENNHTTLEEAQNYFNLKNYILFASVSTCMFGIVLSLVLAFILKKRQ